MRDRVVTLAGALLALAVVYGLFFADDAPRPAARPTTIETADNGLFALHEWLRSEQVATLSLRQRYGMLSDHPDLPADADNVLLTALPYHTPPREMEIAELKAWIDRGNTLLVAASLNDTSDWSFDTTTEFINDLHSLTGIWFAARLSDDDDDESSFWNVFEDDVGPQRYEIEPIGTHPLLQGVSSMTAVSDRVTSIWRAAEYDADLLLELAAMKLSQTPMIWQRQYGNGHIVVVGSGTAFSNRVIAETDNRRFITNVLDRHLGQEGRMIFDDMHQGLSSLYDPDAFFGDSRLHTTIWFVVLFWLLYIVGSSNRLLGPRPDSRAPRQSDYLHAVGSFISNHASKSDAGLWLFRSWFNDVRRHLHLPVNGEPVWDELGNVRTLDPKLLDKLRRQHRTLAGGRKLDLVEVHNTIHRARKAIG